MDTRYDVIIVGTGISGLYTCLNLDRCKRILLITKEKALRSDTYLAQGGISTQLNEQDCERYFEDTMRAGRYQNNPIAVRDMISQSREIIDDIISKGVDFDQNDGELEHTREGGHSIFRILHHKDITGKEIITKLYARVRELSNVTIMEHTLLLDIITDGKCCAGVIVENESKQILPIYASDIVLATGGIGGLFQSSTNYGHITGDSIAIALRNDIELENINYIQIHPTVLYAKTSGRRFLISESVRGEGAILLNHQGERFTEELAPRDVVACAIMSEMARDNTDHVYLDLSPISRDKILSHFPNIYSKCLEEGYDVTCEPIPVVPAQHYLMGGIHIDIHGATSMARLYAVGETACNGVHGANRLASNSLLESLAFSKNCAVMINNLGEADQRASNIKLPEGKLLEYGDICKWRKDNANIIMREIKRKDEVFYDKWCNNESKC